jgi:hypothetical protein
MSNLGPQFYPKGEDAGMHDLPRDATLYHGTAGEIEGGIIRPDLGAYGHGAYATTGMKVASEYASNAARGQGRLFGTVYEVSPTSDRALQVSSEGSHPTMLDPEGLRADKAVAFPPSYSKRDYREANERATGRTGVYHHPEEYAIQSEGTKEKIRQKKVDYILKFFE